MPDICTKEKEKTVMAIDPIKFRLFNQLQGVQKTQGVQSKKAQGLAQNSGSGSGSSLVDKLNSMDNKLNQGGGVNLPGSVTQLGGQNAVHKKRKL